jgi:G3E family GTPase
MVAGPLGAGKTTAILDYLNRHAGEQQVGVLVNDFGPLGLDGAIVEAGTDSAPEIVSLPGGCVCCAGSGGLLDSLLRLAERADLDRILIEPSGLAEPAQVLSLVAQVAGQSRLVPYPTIVLLAAPDFDAERYARMPYYRSLVDAADVLVLNQTDAAGPELVAEFEEWAAALEPAPQQVLTTSHGQLPDAAFAPGSGTPRPATEPSDEAHGAEPDHDHEHPEASDSLTWPVGEPLSHAVLLARLADLAEDGTEGGGCLRRLKGVVHTDRGWFLVQVSSDQVSVRETRPHKENALEWISEAGCVDAATLAETLGISPSAQD